MRRLSVAVLAALCLGAAVPVASAGAAPIVGQFQYAIDSGAVVQNSSWNANATAAANQTASKENVVILQAWETDELRAIKAANPSTIVLMYQDSSAAATTASWSGQYSTGVSYQQAQSNGWLLDNTSGQPFTFQGYNWLYATDIGSAGYQNAWASNVIGELNSAPWDGVFMDDVNPTIAYHYPVSQVAKYPSDAAYSGAMGSFVRNVGPQIQADGKLAIANIGSWSGYASTVDPWLQSLSGAMDEEFLKWGTSAGTGYAPQSTWQAQLQEVALCQSEGKLFLGVTHSAASDEQAAVYGYATELLAGGGTASFSMAQDYTNATWFPEYGYQIGQPTGSYSQTQGVYERAFTNGLALVNPTGSTQRVNLGGTYSGSGLSNVSTVTMAPQTGLVLTPNAGTSTSTSGSGAGSGSTSGSGTTTSSTPATGSGTTTTTGSGSGTTTGSGTKTTTSAPAHNRHWWYERWLHNHHSESLARFLHQHLIVARPNTAARHTSRTQPRSRR
jgi:hypothetical protein